MKERKKKYRKKEGRKERKKTKKIIRRGFCFMTRPRCRIGPSILLGLPGLVL